MFRTRRFNFKEDGCICSYGMVRFTRVGIRSLVYIFQLFGKANFGLTAAKISRYKNNNTLYKIMW